MDFLKKIATMGRADRGVDERRLNQLAWAISIGFLAFLALPLFLGKILTFWDFAAFHLPLRDFYSRCLAAGDRFDWLPNQHGGCFITGEGEGGFYHPWHLLIYRFLPLAQAFALEHWMNFAAMFAGMVVLLRPKTGPAAAVLGALIYTFSNNLWHAYHMNMVAVLAHLPWIMRLLEIGFYDGSPVRRRHAWLGIALLTGSQVLLGCPQAMSWSLLVEVCYSIWLILGCRPSWIRIGALAGAKLLGLVIGAVQLWATFSFLGESNRSQFDPMTASFYPPAFAQLLAPYMVAGSWPVWTSEIFYTGLATVLLAAFWVATARLRRSTPGLPGLSFGWFALLLCLLAAWLAIGSYGGLYKLQTLLPIVGQFRAPQRYLNLVDLGLALLAALAFQQLLDSIRDRKIIAWRHLAVPGVLVGINIALAAYFWSLPSAMLPADNMVYASPLIALAARVVKSIPLTPVLMLLSAGALILAARGRQAGLFLLLLLTAGDLTLYGLIIAPQTRWDTMSSFSDWKAGISLPPEPRAGRILSHAWEYQKLLHTDERLINGYSGGLEPRKFLDYQNPAALRLAQVAWLQPYTDTEPTFGGTPVGGFPGWYRLSTPMPRVRLVSQTLVSQSPGADLQKIDIETTALVAEPLDLPPSTPGTAKLITDRPGSLLIETNAPAPQLLVISESYSAGWRASVDGKPLPVRRVYGDFLGCVVRAGRRQVEWEFSPPGIRYGRWVSLGGLGLVLILGLPGTLKRRAPAAT